MTNDLYAFGVVCLGTFRGVRVVGLRISLEWL